MATDIAARAKGLYTSPRRTGSEVRVHPGHARALHVRRRTEAARGFDVSQIKRVLIYRLGSLGDTVAALPCFHQVMRSFPDAERRVLTNRPVSSKAAPLEIILKDGGFIDGVIEYPVSLRSPRDLATLAARVKAFRPDLLVYLAANRGGLALRRDLLFFSLCGAGRVVGAPMTRDLRLPRQDQDGMLERESHRLARTLAALGPIDVHAPDAFDLRLQPAEFQAAEMALQPTANAPFIAVNTGGKAAQKDWGEANWAALLAALARALPNHGLVFVGSVEDAARAARLARSWTAGGGVLDLCGALSPRVSAAVLARAALFIGHDSGPLHLAAAAGAPSLGLFGDYNRPRMWWPSGPHVDVIHDMNGVEAITVQAVLDAARPLIGAPFQANSAGSGRSEPREGLG